MMVEAVVEQLVIRIVIDVTNSQTLGPVDEDNNAGSNIIIEQYLIGRVMGSVGVLDHNCRTDISTQAR